MIFFNVLLGKPPRAGSDKRRVSHILNRNPPLPHPMGYPESRVTHTNDGSMSGSSTWISPDDRNSRASRSPICCLHIA